MTDRDVSAAEWSAAVHSNDPRQREAINQRITSKAVMPKPRGVSAGIGKFDAHDRALGVAVLKAVSTALDPVVTALVDRLERLERKLDRGGLPLTEAHLEGRLSDLGLDDLRKTVAKLDAEAMRYRGVFRAGNSYPKGSLVTHGGAMWIAERSTDIRPGQGDSGWKLSSKGRS